MSKGRPLGSGALPFLKASRNWLPVKKFGVRWSVSRISAGTSQSHHFVLQTVVPRVELDEIRIAKRGAEELTAVTEERFLPVGIDDVGEIAGKSEIRVRETVDIGLPRLWKITGNRSRDRSKPVGGVREPRLKGNVAGAAQPFGHAFEDARVFDVADLDIVGFGDFGFVGGERKDLGFRNSARLVGDEKTIGSVPRKGARQKAAKPTTCPRAENDTRGSWKGIQRQHSDLSVLRLPH